MADDAIAAHAVTRHGHAPAQRSPTYMSWHGMKQRCRNRKQPTFVLYGGRGINYCGRWELFTAFLEDMGERPTGTTLDRVDPDGNYEPGNCRWASVLEQARNRRTTQRVTINGETRPLTEWCALFGVNVKAARARIYRGVAPELAVTVPSSSRHPAESTTAEDDD